MRLPFIIFALYLVQAQADQTVVNYRDTKGKKWTRYVIQEPQHNGSELLLVIDEPQNKTELSVLVLRRSFAVEELGQLHSLKQSVLEPKDLQRANLAPLTVTSNPLGRRERESYRGGTSAGGCFEYELAVARN